MVKKTSYDDGYLEILDNDKVGMALVWPHFENFRKKYFSKIILGSHISESLQRSFSKLRLHLIQYDRSIDLHLNLKKNIARLGRSSRDIGLVPVEPGSERTP